nr:hypothetical protein [Tanacetum cinerariifolium]
MLFNGDKNHKAFGDIENHVPLYDRKVPLELWALHIVLHTITIDDAYNARSSGQASSLAPSSKDGNTNKPGSDMKPPQRPELANDELRQ